MKTLATIMILALVSFGILAPAISIYWDKRKLINEIKKNEAKNRNKKMDMKNELIMKYILNELQELQRRYFEAQGRHFKINIFDIFGRDNEIDVEFSNPERSFIYEFNLNYREELLLEKLEHLKRKIDNEINMLHNTLHD